MIIDYRLYHSYLFNINFLIKKSFIFIKVHVGYFWLLLTDFLNVFFICIITKYLFVLKYG